jgi:Delta7-sterol 5-desaturase
MFNTNTLDYYNKFIFDYNKTYAITLITLLILWGLILPKLFKDKKIVEFRSINLQKLQLSRELVFSISSMFIFTTVAILLSRYLFKIGYYSGYKNIQGIWGYAYALFSFLLLFVWHDTFFYWTHRIMHHKFVFRHVHKLHHLSQDIGPLSTISFHPIEAVIQSLALFPLLLLVPIYTPVLVLYEIIQVIQAFYGHTGYELYPSGFTKHWLFKHIATSTHHNYHHSRSGGHYGRYFTWWDRILKTEFEDYHEKFEEKANTK